MSLPSLPPLVAPAADLSPDEVLRYSRHLLIPEVGRLGQRRLKNARVLVVGAGGLGAPVLLYLAAAGVGTLGVVDSDVVEASNLQRQVIHRQSDVGRLKVDSAAESLAEVNPLVRVVRHPDRLTSANALDVLARYDLVVDGTDNFATRYLVNDACVLLGKPDVWGSILRFEGQVSVFWADPPAGSGREGVHYRDVYPEPPPAGSVPSCAEAGVLGVLCASIGSIMATEVVKLVTGTGNSLLGRLMVYDALEMNYRTLTIRPDPAGRPVTGLIDYDAFCGAQVQPAVDGAADRTISAIALRDRMAAGNELLLVDVREPGERDIVAIPGSVPIPLAQILSGTALAGLPHDRPLVLHCKSGVRSAQALVAMERAGFSDVVHLAGGVLAWIEQVDPSLPSY